MNGMGASLEAYYRRDANEGAILGIRWFSSRPFYFTGDLHSLYAISYVDQIAQDRKKLIFFKLPICLHVVKYFAKVLSVGHFRFPP